MALGLICSQLVATGDERSFSEPHTSTEPARRQFDEGASRYPTTATELHECQFPVIHQRVDAGPRQSEERGGLAHGHESVSDQGLLFAARH